jgi:CheY-like chemotaxis protein
MKNHFHPLLTDIEIPGMDWWTLTHQIKKISPDTPVILMTGSDGYDNLNKFEQDPADQLLIKPFRYEEFKNAIQIARLSISQP